MLRVLVLDGRRLVLMLARCRYGRRRHLLVAAPLRARRSGRKKHDYGGESHQCADAAHSSARLRRNAFAITETELSVIAALAQMGLMSTPISGYNTPAATGTPRAL